MRNFLFAFASLASLVSLTGVASAEPYDAVTDHAVTAQPDRYVEGGGMVGGNDFMLTAAATLDGGQRLGDSSLWLHGRIAVGAGDRLFDQTVSSGFQQLRLGVDSRGCVADGVLCAFAGMDLGVQHASWSGYEVDWGEETTDSMLTVVDDTKVIAVPRAGLDLGGKHLRWRSGLELPVAPTGVDGANLTTAIAYKF